MLTLRVGVTPSCWVVKNPFSKQFLFIIQNSITMLDATKLQTLLDANKAKASSPNSSVIELLVNRCSPARPVANSKTGELLDVVRLDTNMGTFWPIKSSLSNLPTDFTKPAKCSAVVTVRKIKDAAGVESEVLNISSAEFQGLDNEKALMIKALPKGAALFAA